MTELAPDVVFVKFVTPARIFQMSLSLSELDSDVGCHLRHLGHSRVASWRSLIHAPSCKKKRSVLGVERNVAQGDNLQKWHL